MSSRTLSTRATFELCAFYGQAVRRRSSTGGARFWARAVVTIGRRPRLWATAVAQAGRLARPRWWRRPPFVPLPERDYLRYRLETQYGPDRGAEPQDVVAYLEWCRHMSHLRRSTPR